MSLPQSFRQHGTAILAKHPQIRRRWSVESDHCKLLIPRATPDGFDISFDVEPAMVTLSWGNWHSHIEPTGEIEEFVESQFGLLRDMLSPGMRVRELWAGRAPYRGYLEFLDGKQWCVEQSMCLVFWNYLGSRSVRIFSNTSLTSRIHELIDRT